MGAWLDALKAATPGNKGVKKPEEKPKGVTVNAPKNGAPR